MKILGLMAGLLSMLSLMVLSDLSATSLEDQAEALLVSGLPAGAIAAPKRPPAEQPWQSQLASEV